MELCYSCGEKVKEIKDKAYRYDECGLPVVLYGITQYVCEKCGESYASIPNMQQLNRVIGIYICKMRKAILKPVEIKFLRKDLHLRSKGLAQTLGVTPETVSRWEKGRKAIGEPHDRLLRSLYMMYASEQANQMVCDKVIDTFQAFPIKRKKIDQATDIVLNPQEWMGSLNCLCPA
jgi:putative zinc finger/helix-turn-helix YgiT family protein